MAELDIDRINEQIKKLDVVDNGTFSIAGKGLFYDDDDEIDNLAKSLKDASFEKLNLSGNSIGIKAAAAIGDALKLNSSIKELHLSDLFTRRTLDEIPYCLKHIFDAIVESGAKIEILDLSDSAFGKIGADELVNFFSSPSAWSLHTLLLHNNGLGIGGGQVIANALKTAHHNSKMANVKFNLKTVVIGRNRLENAGATALADAFQTIGTLEEIVMPQNGITGPGIIELLKAFSKNPSLKKIDLSDNTFSKDAAISLKEMLKQLKKLEFVNFDDCLLRNHCAEHLAQGLALASPNLSEIHLNGCEFHTSAASQILLSLKSKASLSKINMNNNQFGKKGVEVIKSIASDLGLADFLGSLSDDDGSYQNGSAEEEEEEEEVEEEVVVEQEEDEMLEEEFVVVESNSLNNYSPTELIELLQTEPKLQHLLALQDEHTREEFLKILTLNKDDMDFCAKTIIGLSSVLTPDCSEEDKTLCLSIWQWISEIFIDQEEVELFVNSLVLHIHLIRALPGMESKFQLYGIYDMLFYVAKEKLFSPIFYDVLKFFIKRKCPKVEDIDSKKLLDVIESLSSRT
ncbi:Ran GTPase-activating protein 1 [Trichinella pseudospiralis]|uniref:Ran GTPase-activating protein 1 n=1 Tax=Trichinella pseudospiralis TaxID=6337 RepID=A0A0V1KGD3_TRIPS|nr:Ran GTPase-activating protein 1 [Trichinella pseudospiralis]KRZ46142.1 Ran GTPase-activating protein 1 [Trichinella pseudospiralis]